MARTHRSLYRFELWDPSLGASGLIANLSPITTSRRFTVGLNRPETLDLTFDLHVIEERANLLGMTPKELLGPGIFDIRVWRANRPLFGTRVRYIRPVLGQSETLELHASGYLDDLAHRYLWPVTGAPEGKTRYEDTDIGQIILDMIVTTQARENGELYITEGVIAPSRELTDDWQAFATSVKDIIITTTERNNSVDVSFSHDRKINVHYPYLGTEKRDLLFSYPGNILSMAMPVDASEVVNVSINRGAGNGLDITPIQTRTDTASMAIYGRMERIDDYPDVSVTETLDSFGDETLRMESTPLIIPDVTLKSRNDPPLGSYWVGDWVRMLVPSRPAFTELNNRMWRIHEIGVNLNDLDSEEIRLTVAS